MTAQSISPQKSPKSRVKILTRAMAALRADLLCEDPGGVGSKERRGGVVGMLLPKEPAKRALHRMMFFHLCQDPLLSSLMFPLAKHASSLLQYSPVEAKTRS